MSLKENSIQQKLHKNKSRGNMNNNNNGGGGSGSGGGGSGLSNSPIKSSNSNTLITNTQYINTKYHNNNNNNTNYYNNKSESSSPNQQQQQQRYSPKIRNSHSYSSTSPFKKNNQLSYSPDHKYRQIFTGNLSSSLNNSHTSPTNDHQQSTVLSTSPTNGVAVPNPFGGSKYRDPPPALSLPLPPLQWMQTDNNMQSTTTTTTTTMMTKTTTSSTPAAAVTASMHLSASFPTSTCSGDVAAHSNKSNDILSKLNHGFRLSTAVQA